MCQDYYLRGDELHIAKQIASCSRTTQNSLSLLNLLKLSRL